MYNTHNVIIYIFYTVDIFFWGVHEGYIDIEIYIYKQL